MANIFSFSFPLTLYVAPASAEYLNLTTCKDFQCTSGSTCSMWPRTGPIYDKKPACKYCRLVCAAGGLGQKSTGNEDRVRVCDCDDHCEDTYCVEEMSYTLPLIAVGAAFGLALCCAAYCFMSRHSSRSKRNALEISNDIEANEVARQAPVEQPCRKRDMDVDMWQTDMPDNKPWHAVKPELNRCQSDFADDTFNEHGRACNPMHSRMGYHHKERIKHTAPGAKSGDEGHGRHHSRKEHNGHRSSALGPGVVKFNQSPEAARILAAHFSKKDVGDAGFVLSKETLADLESMPVEGLKELATEIGVRKDGVSWGVCCPPHGRKHDILQALLVALQDAELKVWLEPMRKIGIGADWESGLVTVVGTGTQADRSGVRVGMRILTVADKPYTQHRYDSYGTTNGNPYKVTFAKVPGHDSEKQSPQTSQSHDSGKPDGHHHHHRHRSHRHDADAKHERDSFKFTECEADPLGKMVITQDARADILGVEEKEELSKQQRQEDAVGDGPKAGHIAFAEFYLESKMNVAGADRDTKQFPEMERKAPKGCINSSEPPCQRAAGPSRAQTYFEARTYFED